MPEESVVVAILCDGGDRYLSCLFNERWLRDNGLIRLAYEAA